MLIEAMVGMVLLLIGLLGIAGLLTNCYTTNANSKQYTVASMLAEKKIEELKAAGYEAAASANDSQTLNSVSFVRTWTVSEASANWTKRAEVTVSWPGGSVAESAYIMK